MHCEALAPLLVSRLPSRLSPSSRLLTRRIAFIGHGYGIERACPPVGKLGSAFAFLTLSCAGLLTEISALSRLTHLSMHNLVGVFLDVGIIPPMPARVGAHPSVKTKPAHSHPWGPSTLGEVSG